MVKGFILGAMVGGIVMWMWHDSLQKYADNSFEPVRSKAGDVLWTVQQKSEGLLDGAKERVSATLESARNRIRPVAAGT
jgi:hypothetical protein